MPNPPFQPLTLSVEEWQRYKSCECTCDTGACAYRDIEPLVRECEAQAQAAASLRQRLEETEAAWRKSLEMPTAMDAAIESQRLQAQLAQAQQERDAAKLEGVRFIEDARRQVETLTRRASQAEAALEEMRKQLGNKEV